MLCDYRDELKIYFPDLWERISFKNVKEMTEKTRYYLENESERLELADLMNLSIISETYKNRMRKLTDQLDVLRIGPVAQVAHQPAEGGGGLGVVEVIERVRIRIHRS